MRRISMSGTSSSAFRNSLMTCRSATTRYTSAVNSSTSSRKRSLSSYITAPPSLSAAPSHVSDAYSMPRMVSRIIPHRDRLSTPSSASHPTHSSSSSTIIFTHPHTFTSITTHTPSITTHTPSIKLSRNIYLIILQSVHACCR